MQIHESSEINPVSETIFEKTVFQISINYTIYNGHAVVLLHEPIDHMACRPRGVVVMF